MVRRVALSSVGDRGVCLNTQLLYVDGVKSILQNFLLDTSLPIDGVFKKLSLLPLPLFCTAFNRLSGDNVSGFNDTAPTELQSRMFFPQRSGVLVLAFCNTCFLLCKITASLPA